MGRLDGKVAVNTGAASGIGRRTAEVFVEEGAKVVVADLDEERGRRVAEALGPQASFIRADVANGAEIRSAIEHALERFGRLDIMFNNAGFGGARATASRSSPRKAGMRRWQCCCAPSFLA